MDGQDQKIAIERFDPEASYDFSQFDCGVAAFNEYLTSGAIAKEYQRRICIPHLCALETEGAQPKRVVGFFTLASSAFEKSHVSAKEQRRNPYRTYPCILLSKLAVCSSMQGQGMGKWLLGKAIQRAYLSSRDVAVYALFIHAKNGKESFYEAAGMVRSKLQDDIFIYPLKQYEQSLKNLSKK